VILRLIHLWLASWLLTQAALASACHSVGEVHVICSAQGLETVYVPSPETEAQPRPDCCPTAASTMLEALSLAFRPGANAAPKAPIIWPQHALRFDSAATPRAPPKSVFA
jgi:7-cyano-7-deazaguanine synthase in queuosine biosynthesis